MKKKLFFLPLVAALALTGCSDDEPVIDGGENGTGSEGTRYLAVNIVSTDNVGSRAEGTESTGSTNGSYTDINGLSFEDGTTAENQVKTLRIYFFNSVGNPVDVKGNGSNYYDVEPEKIHYTASNHDITVEKGIAAIVVVNAGEYLPTKMVAVVNPNTDPTTGLGSTPYSLNVLQREVRNYAAMANGGQFVMANSVYLEGGQIIRSSAILPENFATSAEQAEEHPVTMYVERNVAKVRVRNGIPGASENTTDGGILVPVMTKDKESTSGTKQLTVTRPADNNNDGKPDVDADNNTVMETVNVYAKFLAWDVTADLSYAYMLKSINADWKDQIANRFVWNAPSYHRSYWAGVCYGNDVATNQNNYFSYSGANAIGHFSKTNFNGTDVVYCNENAEKTTRTNPLFFESTKVIIKAQLCDQDGNPLTLSEFAGTVNVDNATFSSLKSRYLDLLKSGKAHSHYKVYFNADGSVNKYEEIGPNDITFITSNEAKDRGLATPVVPDENPKVGSSDKGTYYVYACLTDEAAAATDYKWYTEINREVNENTGEVINLTVDDKYLVSAGDIDNHLYELSHSKIWNTGMAYYFADILHVPGENPIAAVVRNHIYDLNLTQVIGMGTPVYNPDEVIIPEKPQADDTFVAAEIKILSWRVVAQSVALDWESQQ